MALALFGTFTLSEGSSPSLLFILADPTVGLVTHNDFFETLTAHQPMSSPSSPPRFGGGKGAGVEAGEGKREAGGDRRKELRSRRARSHTTKTPDTKSVIKIRNPPMGVGAVC